MSAGSSPYKIVAGPDANMWYTDVDGARIGRITPSGTVTEFPTPTADSMPGGITAAPDGNLWFTELAAGRVGKITPAGVITETPMGDILLEGGIAVGPDDNLWSTGLLHPHEDTYIPAIVRMTLDGEATTFTAGLSTNAIPVGITRGPDDNMWFTDATGRIGRITPTGVGSGSVSQTDPLPRRRQRILLRRRKRQRALRHRDRSGRQPLVHRVHGCTHRANHSCGHRHGIRRIDREQQPERDHHRSRPEPLVHRVPEAHRIGRITTSGVVTEYAAGISLDSSPFAIAADLSGMLWFVDTAHARIGRVAILDRPSVTTYPASAIGTTTATLTGSDLAADSATGAHFEYGTTTSYGTSTAVRTAGADTITPVTAALAGLQAATKYYFRLVATNLSATTQSSGSFTTTPLPPATEPPPPASTTTPPPSSTTPVPAPSTTPPPPTAPTPASSLVALMARVCPVVGRAIVGTNAADAPAAPRRRSSSSACPATTCCVAARRRCSYGGGGVP